jgi:hypothetical protein
MCLVLSDDEMAVLALLANRWGTSKVGAVRRLLHDAAAHRPMPPPAELRSELRAVFGRYLAGRRDAPPSPQ